eukprot:CAMPEP_0172844846 /NCGR_PEP_ID=MMETSP1075-20121228/32518_1 /TAXON_ID=2916 /ORGANISM="Ceratium fusus, Strain PA161109" /LENGTH=44 /DNA_ID= /DNA_START= /DNA_END= /DNA_ORIENTATION=
MASSFDANLAGPVRQPWQQQMSRSAAMHQKNAVYQQGPEHGHML